MATEGSEEGKERKGVGFLGWVLGLFLLGYCGFDGFGILVVWGTGVGY